MPPTFFMAMEISLKLETTNDCTTLFCNHFYLKPLITALKWDRRIEIVQDDVTYNIYPICEKEFSTAQCDGNHLRTFSPEGHMRIIMPSTFVL